jgi:hypothetical protein
MLCSQARAPAIPNPSATVLIGKLKRDAWYEPCLNLALNENASASEPRVAMATLYPKATSAVRVGPISVRRQQGLVLFGVGC